MFGSPQIRAFLVCFSEAGVTYVDIAFAKSKIRISIAFLIVESFTFKTGRGESHIFVINVQVIWPDGVILWVITDIDIAIM